jgi:hypothetical protein
VPNDDDDDEYYNKTGWLALKKCNNKRKTIK